MIAEFIMWHSTENGNTTVHSFCPAPPDEKQVVKDVLSFQIKGTIINAEHDNKRLYVLLNNGDRHIFCLITKTLIKTIKSQYAIASLPNDKLIIVVNGIEMIGTYQSKLVAIAPLSEYPGFLGATLFDCGIVAISSDAEIPVWNPKRKIIDAKAIPYMHFISHGGKATGIKIDDVDGCTVTYYQYKWSWANAALQTPEIKQRAFGYILGLTHLRIFPRPVIMMIAEIAMDPA